MPHILEDLVRCPQCKASHCTLAEAFSCPKCGTTFPMTNGFVDLIPELEFERTRAQALMESPTMAKIYDGILWRRSFWQGNLVLGISFEREATMILEAARVRPTSTVLDLACASGIYARRLARVATEGRVVGLDLSRPMLEVAVQRARAESLGNLAFVRGTAQELPCDDGCFDCLNCCGALHLFPNVSQALAEIARVLKPGGRFTMATFRKRSGVIGRAHVSGSEAIGVNCQTPEGLEAALGPLGFSNPRLHHDSARWMIMSAERVAC